MFIGYMRVSTEDQNLDLQRDALKQAGCEKCFEDYGSGSKADRPGLIECLSYLRDGEDVLMVWKCDRLGRSLKELIEIVEKLKSRKIGIKSITEGIMDTTTANGELIFGIFALLAQYERSLLRERTLAGLKSARARGRFGGRPVKLTEEKKKLAKTLFKDESLTIKQISRHLNVSPSTLYHYHAKIKNDEHIS
jgi:DNA invertase Pin-like site-specific DNA recombinase